MTFPLACIVEGQGEVEAVPVLVQRIAAQAFPDVFVSIVRPPIRLPRNRLVKAGELERAVELAARRAGRGGATLVLIDSDDDCPAQLGPELQKRAEAVRPGFPISVVMAKREFEAWFLTAAESLRGKRELRDDLSPPADPEGIRDAKGWLRDRMPAGRKYRRDARSTGTGRGIRPSSSPRQRFIRQMLSRNRQTDRTAARLGGNDWAVIVYPNSSRGALRRIRASRDVTGNRRTTQHTFGNI